MAEVKVIVQGRAKETKIGWIASSNVAKVKNNMKAMKDKPSSSSAFL